MDSYSLPTLPFIARYDTHDATKSPSTPHHKKQNTNTGNSIHFSLLLISILSIFAS